MVAEWIKVRRGLRQHPKTVIVASKLEETGYFKKLLPAPAKNDTGSLQHHKAVTSEFVTRVTVSALVDIWVSLNDVVDKATQRAREFAQPADCHEASRAQPPQPRALQHGAPAAPRVLERLAHPHLHESARVTLALDHNDNDNFQRTSPRNHLYFIQFAPP